MIEINDENKELSNRLTKYRNAAPLSRKIVGMNVPEPALFSTMIYLLDVIADNTSNINTLNDKISELIDINKQLMEKVQVKAEVAEITTAKTKTTKTT